MNKLKRVLLIFIVFLIDQVSKIIVMNSISLNKSIDVVKNFFRITYTHNDGAAFGFFGGKTIFIVFVSLIVLLYLLYELFIKKNKSFVLNIGNIFLIGGLLGNLVDRLYFGYVRDFLDFKLFGYEAPIFNLGDTAIVIGAILFFVGAIMEEKYERDNN